MSLRNNTVAYGRCRRFRKQQRDLALRKHLIELDGVGHRQMFVHLLHEVRSRSNLLSAQHRIRRGQPQIEVLANLAANASDFVRPVTTWPGRQGSIYEVVADLVQHLLGEYPVPRFLCSVFYGGRTDAELEKRRWLVHQARGGRFRDLSLPLLMTRRMEHHFLASPDDLTVEAALRRSECLALGGSPDLADVLIATRLGRDLSNADFWRTVVQFLVKFEDKLDLEDVGPVVDFLQAVRHGALDDTGVEILAPPEPDFSMKGRTWASVLTLTQRWHRQKAQQVGRWTWASSGYQPMVVPDVCRRDDKEWPFTWEIVELLGSRKLFLEGRSMQHCVAGYAVDCRHGRSQIWSLRRSDARGTCPVVTIEVDPFRRCVVQARGRRNRSPSAQEIELIRGWARREGIGWQPR